MSEMFLPEVLGPFERLRKPLSFRQPSQTKQAFKDECDINNILRRFEKTAIVEHLNRHEGRYGDFTDVPQDYQACLDQVRNAEAMFMELPAKLRARFANNPGHFLAFVDDPANAQEMENLGLARRKAPPASEDNGGKAAGGPPPAAPAVASGSESA